MPALNIKLLYLQHNLLILITSIIVLVSWKHSEHVISAQEALCKNQGDNKFVQSLPNVFSLVHDEKFSL